MKLHLLPQTFGILKLTPPQVIPAWATSGSHFFIAQTNDELSIMCPQVLIPAEVAYSADWRCFRVDGDLEFDEIGVVARVSKPLADNGNGMSLFLVSTHDRDYVFVAQNDLDRAIQIYQLAGFTVTSS